MVRWNEYHNDRYGARSPTLGCLVMAAGAAILAAIPVSGMMCNNAEYSNGVRTGMINKFSKKGYLVKTYEGQMALEGIASNGNSVGANIWDFSLDGQQRHGENTDELAQKFFEYIDAGTKVKVTYVEPWATWPWRSGTSHLVQKVEPVKGNKYEK